MSSVLQRSAGRRVPGGVVLLGGVVGAVLVAAALAARLVPGGPGRLIDLAEHAARHLGPVGLVVFAGIQVLVAFSGALPASLLGIAAGAVYGVAGGFALAAASTMAGAWLAFRASRSLFRPRIERLLAARPRLRSLDATLARERWRFVCLLRVSPVMPFAITSYVLGLSSVSRRDYLLGTLAALPALFGYVCLGGLAKAGLVAGNSGAGPMRWVLIGVGIVATVLLTLQMGRVLKRAGIASDDAGSDQAAEMVSSPAM